MHDAISFVREISFAHQQLNSTDDLMIVKTALEQASSNDNKKEIVIADNTDALILQISLASSINVLNKEQGCISILQGQAIFSTFVYRMNTTSCFLGQVKRTYKII